MDKIPNIFSFATSELSQDAFICWLISWADKRHESETALHRTALYFLNQLFGKSPRPMPERIYDLKVVRQDGNIDVLVIINSGEYAIIIEDKTDTINHSDQLSKYYKYVLSRGYTPENVIPIYFKTGDQSCYKNIYDNKYHVFLRSDFLDVLRFGRDLGVENSIFTDYLVHLENIESRTNSYKKLALHEWHGRSWVGFFKELKEELKHGNWGSVPNPKGGFVGYWWNGVVLDNYEVYLQLEEENLCFKIKVTDKQNRSRYRNELSKKILKVTEAFGINAKRPSRFGNGKHMTLALLEGYRQKDEGGLLDIGKTVSLLKKAEMVIDSFTLPRDSITA